MKYGFIIDNRKCIGCHACTTACKSEHDVAVGVNRTWVKQVEKGIFPNTRRFFSVMRCNHCTDAPCVEICPTEALFIRSDGIVDFDKDRCIGCKSCMQACPYDALYIDPDTNTAAKCNYCASRIDIGLEPACVNVCPEHAIISGDMEDPDSEISMLLSRQQTKVRKPEKATVPNLFYIDADDVSLIPASTEKESDYMWNAQSLGVGHFAKEAEKMAFSNSDIVSAVLEKNEQYATEGEVKKNGNTKSVDLLLGKARRAYDSPDKGMLWGWEVSAYVWTKAISAGVFLITFLAWLMGLVEFDSTLFFTALITSFLFLTITGLLLIKDLDRPDRFLYVLLRPHWKSWLVKGGYAIALFGSLLSLLILSRWMEWSFLVTPVLWITTLCAIIVAIYTAFLLAQAKGRDFWQSPTLSIHMLLHSIMAGAAFYLIISPFLSVDSEWLSFLKNTLLICVGINLFVIAIELITTHPTGDMQTTIKEITKGRYRNLFWLGVIIIGNIIPAFLLWIGMVNISIAAITGVLIMAGIYITEHIWVEAPQRIPLS